MIDDNPTEDLLTLLLSKINSCKLVIKYAKSVFVEGYVILCYFIINHKKVHIKHERYIIQGVVEDYPYYSLHK